MKDILCPTDLTITASRGVAIADQVAAKIGGSVTLLHVMDKQELKGDGPEKAKAIMDHQCAIVQHAPANCLFREGDFIKEIDAESRNGHALMVCGTHGPRGLRQSLFGSDILKLIRAVPIPALVVQEQSPKELTMDPIVLPVAAHETLDHLLDAVVMMARTYGSEVHIYQLVRPGESASEHLLRNKVRMLDRMKSEGIPCKEVNEPSTTFSVGFAAPTIAYAQKVGAGCIAIMSVASDDFRYIADAEKERILTNEPGIPVLCAH